MYSNDGINFKNDYGSNCNLTTGYQCSKPDGVNPKKGNYCISYDGVNCFTDNGQMCQVSFNES